VSGWWGKHYPTRANAEKALRALGLLDDTTTAHARAAGGNVADIRVAEPYEAPEIGTVAATCGRVGAITLDGTTLASLRDSGKRFFTLRVLDHSMEPVVRPGQKVEIDVMLEPAPGNIVVTDLAEEENGEELYVKRFIVRNGKYVFESVNPSEGQEFRRDRKPRTWFVVTKTHLL